MVGHDTCSYPGLARPPNLPMSASSGQNLGEPSPSTCLGSWAAWAPGLSIQLARSSYRRWLDLSLGNGNLRAVGRCRVPRPCRRHGDAMDEAIPLEIYNASPIPHAFSIVRGRAESLGTQQIGRHATLKLTSQPRQRCDTLGYNASDWVALRSRPRRRDCLLPVSLSQYRHLRITRFVLHLHGSSLVESKQTRNTRQLLPLPNSSRLQLRLAKSTRFRKAKRVVQGGAA